MRYTDQLEEVFDKHFASIARDRHWKGPELSIFPNGAIAEYTCGHLRVRFVNERGLVEIEIGSVSVPGQAFSIARHKERLEPPRKGHWNLSMVEASRFLRTHWDRLSNDLSPERANETVDELSKLKES